MSPLRLSRREVLEMTQADLFENRQQIHAAADPVTSKLAAEEHTRSGRRSSDKTKVYDFLGLCKAPVTSAELAAAYELDRYMVARRLPDLAADRCVERCGIRTCSVGGRPAVVWRVKKSSE